MIIEDARNVDNISGEKGSKKENEKGKLNSKKKTSSLHNNEGSIESIEMDSRLLSALLTGVNRSFPYATSDEADDILEVQMPILFKLIIEIRLPSFCDNFDPRAGASNFPSSVQAYLAGLTFALAASPCTTPVLATLLGYVAASRDAVIGGSLLLTYTTGYIAPLLVAASFAGALKWSAFTRRRFVGSTEMVLEEWFYRNRKEGFLLLMEKWRSPQLNLLVELQ